MERTTSTGLFKQTLAPVADVDPKLGQQVEVDYDLPQTSLQLAFPGVKRSAPDFYAAEIMNEILGGSPFNISRLFAEVREKRGLTYSVGSALVDHEHSNALVVTTATRSDCAAETLVRKVVKQMAQEGLTEAEFEAAKKYLIGAYAINNLDSSSSIAATLVDLQLDKLGIDYIQRRAALIDQVTLDEVKAAAKKLLSTEPAIMVVGPPLGAKDEARAPFRFLLPWLGFFAISEVRFGGVMGLFLKACGAHFAGLALHFPVQAADSPDCGALPPHASLPSGG